jgi:hypothetical protein
MPAKLCALLIGAAYLFFGVCGTFDSLLSMPQHDLRFYYHVNLVGHWGYLFSWMPVNTLHNVVFIVVGAAGVLSAALYLTAILYCRTICAVALMFTTIGLLPMGISWLWGLMPLYGWNVMFNTVVTILGYYYGLIYPMDRGGPETPEIPEST